MAGAAKRENIPLLKWLKDQKSEWDRSCCRLATQGCSWDANTYKGAADGDHLEVLKWALNNGCDWDMNTTVAGSNPIGPGRTHNQLIKSTVVQKCKKVLKWLKMEITDEPLTADFLAQLANRQDAGGRKMVRWAIKNGCPSDARTPNALASFDHWQTFMWVVEHGCPLDAESVRTIVVWAELEILQWAHSNGYLSKHSDDAFSEIILRTAVKKLKMETLRWCAKVEQLSLLEGLV